MCASVCILSFNSTATYDRLYIWCQWNIAHIIKVILALDVMNNKTE